MRATKNAAAIAAFVLVFSGCNTAEPFIPDKVLNVSPSLQIPYEVAAVTVVAGVIAWQVLDPLAPTWEIFHIKHADTQYEITLRRKRFPTSGSGMGEAQHLFKRHAQSIAAQHGYSSYTITSYEEFTESEFMVDRRVGRGTIRLDHSMAASS
ncbi:MAG: hypothetical protein JSU95_01035 [Betaproteobacteria bacterium]|nr:MAG: hypothetical protein JSU95_01035 [Betaproteobacteria bacterium]